MKLCILIAILLLPLMAGGQATFYWDGHEIEQRENGEIYWVVPMTDYIVLHHDSIDAFVDSVVAERQQKIADDVWLKPYPVWEIIPLIQYDTVTVCDTVWTWLGLSGYYGDADCGEVYYEDKYNVTITCRDSLVRKE